MAVILIVDDEPVNFDVIETLLSGDNHQLHYAADSVDAFGFLEQLQPDLILLDVMLPGVNGINMCQIIKANPEWQSIPIIMITALSEKEDLARCLKAGADDFISKPVHSLELRARVKSMLRIKRQYGRLQQFSELQRETISMLSQNLTELTGDITFTFPHEVNVPILSISAAIRLLQDRLESMDIADMCVVLAVMNDSIHSLEELTKKFLNYLELSTKEQPSLILPKTHFSATAIEIELRAQAQRIDRSQDLSFHLQEAQLSIPPEYLSMLLQELVENSLKFSSPGTLIKVSSQVDGASLILTVHDSGKGIPQEHVATINTFMQSEFYPSAQGGVGLGLKIVKKIVKLAGGQFSLTSLCQQETEVNIRLPLSSH
uniref:histidine kinase n=1 Tax=Cyanothece sp. (strain PCC 7425 / ATCC 29141) TaxID=395961 RepID=B8HNN3_CYAP4